MPENKQENVSEEQQKKRREKKMSEKRQQKRERRERREKRGADDLYERLGTNRALRRRLGKKFMDLQEGDWQGLVDMAQEEGYEFTIDELKAKLPAGFFKGSGRHPKIGWAASTRDK